MRMQAQRKIVCEACALNISHMRAYLACFNFTRARLSIVKHEKHKENQPMYYVCSTSSFLFWGMGKMGKCCVRILHSFGLLCCKGWVRWARWATFRNLLRVLAACVYSTHFVYYVERMGKMGKMGNFSKPFAGILYIFSYLSIFSLDWLTVNLLSFMSFFPSFSCVLEQLPICPSYPSSASFFCLKCLNQMMVNILFSLCRWFVFCADEFTVTRSRSR